MVTGHKAVRTQEGLWTPEGPEECAAIRSHLEQILGSQFFRNSRRYPDFLRYVVNETLDGRGARVKERTLGIEIFGRKPDYDTNLDHIVRSTATEVRKRLIRYYQENGHKSDIRIDLPQRSYAPFFRRVINRSEEKNHGFFESRPMKTVLRGTVSAVLAAIVLFLGGATVEYFMGPPARVSAKSGRQNPPFLAELLTPVAGQRLDAVIGDPVLETLDAQTAGNLVTLTNYKNHRFNETEERPDLRYGVPTWRILEGASNLHMLLVSRIFHSMSPAQIFLMTPSEITAQDLQRDNTLLIEGPRANPWVQLFENRMNFRTEVQATSHIAEIRDIAPRPGEQHVYADVPATGSHPGRYYGHIAYFPASSNHGKVLVVDGPESSYAALCFATDPADLARVLQIFHADRLAQLPPFELLLEFSMKRDPVIGEPKIIAFRREPENR